MNLSYFSSISFFGISEKAVYSVRAFVGLIAPTRGGFLETSLPPLLFILIPGCYK